MKKLLLASLLTASMAVTSFSPVYADDTLPVLAGNEVSGSLDEAGTDEAAATEAESTEWDLGESVSTEAPEETSDAETTAVDEETVEANADSEKAELAVEGETVELASEGEMVELAGVNAETESADVDFAVETASVKKTNSIAVKTTGKTFYAASSLKKAHTFSIGATSKTKIIKFWKKSGSKYLSVDSKGKIHVKAGTPAGDTYKIKVGILAKSSSTYKAKTRYCVVKVKVISKVKEDGYYGTTLTRTTSGSVYIKNVKYTKGMFVTTGNYCYSKDDQWADTVNRGCLLRAFTVSNNCQFLSYNGYSNTYSPYTPATGINLVKKCNGIHCTFYVQGGVVKKVIFCS